MLNEISNTEESSKIYNTEPFNKTWLERLSASIVLSVETQDKIIMRNTDFKLTHLPET